MYRYFEACFTGNYECIERHFADRPGIESHLHVCQHPRRSESSLFFLHASLDFLRVSSCVSTCALRETPRLVRHTAGVTPWLERYSSSAHMSIGEIVKPLPKKLDFGPRWSDSCPWLGSLHPSMLSTFGRQAMRKTARCSGASSIRDINSGHT